MKDALKNIDQAYGLLSQLVVNGDNVDILAGARQALRVAYTQLEAAMKEEEDRTLEEKEEREGNEDGNHHRQTAENAE